MEIYGNIWKYMEIYKQKILNISKCIGNIWKYNKDMEVYKKILENE